jgi:hypothetical protein
MTRNKLYTILLIACFAGFIYLIYSAYNSQKEAFGFCIIKTVTTYPCPSCGTTRAILMLLKGRILESILLNPFGMIVAVIMTVCPVWVLTDIVCKKDTFFKWYKKTEATITKPWLAIILIVLVLLNWIWNIYKHL